MGDNSEVKNPRRPCVETVRKVGMEWVAADAQGGYRRAYPYKRQAIQAARQGACIQTAAGRVPKVGARRVERGRGRNAPLRGVAGLGFLRQLEDQHAFDTPAYYEAVLQAVDRGVVSGAVVVGSGFKNPRKAAIAWLEERMRETNPYYSATDMRGRRLATLFADSWYDAQAAMRDHLAQEVVDGRLPPGLAARWAADGGEVVPSSMMGEVAAKRSRPSGRTTRYTDAGVETLDYAAANPGRRWRAGDISLSPGTVVQLENGELAVVERVDGGQAWIWAESGSFWKEVGELRHPDVSRAQVSAFREWWEGSTSLYAANPVDSYPFGRTGRHSQGLRWRAGPVEYEIEVGRDQGGFAGGSLTYYAPGARTGEPVAVDDQHWWKLKGEAFRHLRDRHPAVLEGLDTYQKARIGFEIDSSLRPTRRFWMEGEAPLPWDPREGNPLSRQERADLKPSQFALPKQRLWPIQNERQARTALSMAEWPQNAKYRRRVRAAVYKKYPSLRPTRSEARAGDVVRPGSTAGSPELTGTGRGYKRPKRRSNPSGPPGVRLPSDRLGLGWYWSWSGEDSTGWPSWTAHPYDDRHRFYIYGQPGTWRVMDAVTGRDVAPWGFAFDDAHIAAEQADQDAQGAILRERMEARPNPRGLPATLDEFRAEYYELLTTFFGQGLYGLVGEEQRAVADRLAELDEYRPDWAETVDDIWSADQQHDQVQLNPTAGRRPRRTQKLLGPGGTR